MRRDTVVRVQKQFERYIGLLRFLLLGGCRGSRGFLCGAVRECQELLGVATEHCNEERDAHARRREIEEGGLFGEADKDRRGEHREAQ